jgi:hypothetical protein
MNLSCEMKGVAESLEMQMLKVAAQILLAVCALTAMAPPSARADSFWELEHARANARAGGPVSDRDAELLERYGCLSGTKSAFCESLNPGKKKVYRAERKRRPQ